MVGRCFITYTNWQELIKVYFLRLPVELCASLHIECCGLGGLEAADIAYIILSYIQGRFTPN